MTEWLVPYRQQWDALSSFARSTLQCLCKHGPTWDGDIPSKIGRDELVDKGMASRIVIKDSRFGYQAATYKGAHVYRAGQETKP